MTHEIDDRAYRESLRRWLAEHSADVPRGGDHREYLRWQTMLYRAGFLGVTWPRKYGGWGESSARAVIAQEEIERAGVPGVWDVLGLEIFGPTILQHGTEDQKTRYLPRMLDGAEQWCQLFSEPAAGSDLAGITTRATRSADGSWRLNGQKVWTTHAQFARFGVALVRNDVTATKHAGLTMMIVPMDDPGVTVRGLRQISGEAEFNEVFLDDVHVPAENVLGSVGGGWQVAMTALMFERSSMGLSGEGMSLRAERFARAVSRAGAAKEPTVLRRLGDIAVELLAVSEGSARAAAAMRQGAAPSVAVGLDKVTMVNAALAGCELVEDVLGPDALDEDGDPEWSYLVSFLPGLRSAGGTEEILRNTVGERLLGLPSEPRVDKGVPFNEIPTGVRVS